MPTVLRIGSYRFHFYSDEGEEPPHVHVATTDGECKFWLDPVRLARNKGVPPRTVRAIEPIQRAHSPQLAAGLTSESLNWQNS
ncbi:MAG: DUF4160 domain-containing protein [Deltaproteobacteria bacterium]|nr:DUF4160 domain-containing protein [Deltaproteobacteria bacterium]